LCARHQPSNAEWCDIICRLHGQDGTFHDGGWTVPRRSPPFYPDAIMLEPTTSVSAVLAAIDTSAGCSLKDSFAWMDLAPDGFRVLFDARWIHRASTSPPPGPSVGMRWEPVRDPSALRNWERAWNQDDAPPGVFGRALLGNDAVLVTAGYQGRPGRCGAIANRSATVAACRTCSQ